jgi:diguanylate cyclase (GGDEF)-like protein
MATESDFPRLGEALAGAFARTHRALALVRADAKGDGRIVWANASLAGLTARTGNGLAGADVLDALGCGRRPDARDVMRALVDGEMASAFLQSRLVRPDGRLMSLDIELSGADGDPLTGRWVLVGARDVTDEVRAAEARRVRDVMTSVLAAAGSVEGSISALLPALADALGFAFGALWRVDEQAGELRCGALWEAGSSTNSFASLSRELPLDRGIGLPGRAWETGAPVATVDLCGEDCPRAPAAARDGLCCAVAFPIFVGSQLHGVFEFAATAQRDVGDHLLSLLTELGAEMTGVLTRKRAHERHAGTTLLLVEDNAFIARLVAEMLVAQQTPLELVHVESIADARAALAASRPACVLLDLTLPDADGLQSLLAVRSAAPDVPVVVLTGIDDEEMAVRAVQEGAQDYLVKRRVDLDGLGRAIRYAIERKRTEQQLLEHELTDALTGLPNRVLFMDRVRVELARPGRGFVSVLLINLDRFRLVNDSLGHQWGDRLLIAAAERIVHTAPAEASVASFGGDEFAVLLQDTATDRALQLAEELVEAVSVPYELNGESVHVTATVGVATNAEGGASAETLVSQADSAMSRAKEFDGPRCELFDEALQEALRERLALQTGLRAAIEGGELRLHYQPLVSLADRHVVGFEALVRWQHPERGVVLPDGFLPLAEESALIVPIGRWALEEAVRQLVAWGPGAGDRPPPVMHVNLSARELAEPDLVEVVASTLRAGGLSPQRLCLEVTETSLIGDLERSARTLQALRELGVGVAIDDFGTGYSSLSYLERFPVTVIKLDRSFINALGSAGKRAIVAAVGNMAEALGMPALAEGIEREEQLEQVRALGYTLGQGWLFGRPVPADEARSLSAPIASVATR